MKKILLMLAVLFAAMPMVAQADEQNVDGQVDMRKSTSCFEQKADFGKATPDSSVCHKDTSVCPSRGRHPQPKVKPAGGRKSKVKLCPTCGKDIRLCKYKGLHE